MRSVWLGSAVFFVAATSFASPELPASFDARVVGMGGTATANVDNAVGVLYNPAAIDRVEHASVTLGFSPLVIDMFAPLAGPDSRVMAETSIAPLFFLGGVYRVFDRVTLGAGVFPMIGGGTRYEDKPYFGGIDPEVTVAAVEGVGVVSFRIFDGLSVAAGLRSTYVQQVIYLPVELAPGVTGTLDTTMTGLDFLGATAGIDWQVNDVVRLGFCYRSKITVDVDGDATLNIDGTDQEVKSATEVALPHSLRAGGSLSFLQKRLTLAADVKLLLHEEANRTSTLVITGPSGRNESVTPDNWRNTWTFLVGGEYFFTERWAGRLGYGHTQMATAPETTGPFSLPPGAAHTFHAGLGVTLGRWKLDLGGLYALERYDISAADNPVPGEYGFHGFMASLSGSVRF